MAYKKFVPHFHIIMETKNFKSIMIYVGYKNNATILYFLIILIKLDKLLISSCPKKKLRELIMHIIKSTCEYQWKFDTKAFLPPERNFFLFIIAGNTFFLPCLDNARIKSYKKKNRVNVSVLHAHCRKWLPRSFLWNKRRFDGL